LGVNTKPNRSENCRASNGGKLVFGKVEISHTYRRETHCIKHPAWCRTSSFALYSILIEDRRKMTVYGFAIDEY